MAALDRYTYNREDDVQMTVWNGYDFVPVGNGYEIKRNGVVVAWAEDADMAERIVSALNKSS